MCHTKKNVTLGFCRMSVTSTFPIRYPRRPISLFVFFFLVLLGSRGVVVHFCSFVLRRGLADITGFVSHDVHVHYTSPTNPCQRKNNAPHGLLHELRRVRALPLGVVVREELPDVRHPCTRCTCTKAMDKWANEWVGECGGWRIDKGRIILGAVACQRSWVYPHTPCHHVQASLDARHNTQCEHTNDT